MLFIVSALIFVVFVPLVALVSPVIAWRMLRKPSRFGAQYWKHPKRNAVLWAVILAALRYVMLGVALVLMGVSGSGAVVTLDMFVVYAYIPELTLLRQGEIVPLIGLGFVFLLFFWYRFFTYCNNHLHPRTHIPEDRYSSAKHR